MLFKIHQQLACEMLGGDLLEIESATENAYIAGYARDKYSMSFFLLTLLFTCQKTKYAKFHILTQVSINTFLFLNFYCLKYVPETIYEWVYRGKKGMPNRYHLVFHIRTDFVTSIQQAYL